MSSNFKDKLLAKDRVTLSYVCDESFKSLMGAALNEIDKSLRSLPNMKSAVT
jgi:hypothetical protein